MKIAILTDGIFPFKLGGIQKYAANMAKQLAEKCVSVTVYTDMPDLYSKEQLRDFFGNKNQSLIQIIPASSPSILKFWGHYIIESYLFSREIRKELIKHSYDLIYAQGFTGLSLLFKKNSINTPVITNLHGLEMFQEAVSVRDQFQKYLLRIPAYSLLLKSEYLVSLGGKLNDIINKYRKVNCKLLELPNGVDASWICAGPKEKKNGIRKFVFIGRYERRKGIQELNTVLNKLKDKFKFEFDFIGPIPDELRILHSNIKYHGSISDEVSIKNILAEIDCLVCPSLSEGMPTVILEAMACKCSIIATDVGATSCLVSEKNGWLIQPRDVYSLEKSIVNAIKISLEEMNEKQNNSQNIIKGKYTWDITTDLFIKEVEKILAE